MDKKIQEALNFLQTKFDFNASIALILGSGLGNFTEQIKDKIVTPFRDIPNFPVSTVQGHAGELIYGTVNEKKVLVCAGRVHFYEGYSLEDVTFPVQLLCALGIEILLITNAAGSVNEEFLPGELMIIDKQINLTGHSAILGEEPRIPYLRRLGDLAFRLAKEHDIRMRRGTYMGLTGPTYETPSEIKYFRFLGADAVGMSTIHETVVAHSLGIDILGISVLTNFAAGILDQPLSHEEVMETGLLVRDDFAKLLSEIIKQL